MTDIVQDGPRLSYSALSTYLECGEKYRLSRVERVPRAPAYWFPGGTAVHYGCEVYDLAILDGDAQDVATAKAIKAFHDKFNEEIILAAEAAPGMDFRAGGKATKANPNKEDGVWWRNDGPVQVKQYCEWREAHSLLEIWHTPDGQPAVELAFDMPMDDYSPAVRGYIDRVFVNTATGDLIVVDIKTGSRIPADFTQLAIYATAVEVQFGVRPQFGCYYMSRKREMTTPMDLSRFNATMLGQWFAKAREGIERNIFIPHLTSMCGTCEVADFCYAKNADVPTPDLSA